MTSGAVASALEFITIDNVISAYKEKSFSGSGGKYETVGSITLPANHRYLLFVLQRSNASLSGVRMDSTYLTGAHAGFQVCPNSDMEAGEGSLTIAYYGRRSNDVVVNFGMGYNYYGGTVTYNWTVAAIYLDYCG